MDGYKSLKKKWRNNQKRIQNLPLQHSVEPQIWNNNIPALKKWRKTFITNTGLTINKKKNLLNRKFFENQNYIQFTFLITYTALCSK